MKIRYKPIILHIQLLLVVNVNYKYVKNTIEDGWYQAIRHFAGKNGENYEFLVVLFSNHQCRNIWKAKTRNYFVCRNIQTCRFSTNFLTKPIQYGKHWIICSVYLGPSGTTCACILLPQCKRNKCTLESMVVQEGEKNFRRNRERGGRRLVAQWKMRVGRRRNEYMRMGEEWGQGGKKMGCWLWLMHSVVSHRTDVQKEVDLVSVAGDQQSQRLSFQNSTNVVNQWIILVQMYCAMATELMDWFHRWSSNFN